VTYQANNPEQVKKRQDSVKARQEQQRKDLKELLELPQFRRYLWRHMNETCKRNEEAFNPNGSIQSYNCGMQGVSKILWAEIEAIDPKVIPRMMLEYLEEQK
jgi:hypothetical protein